MVGNGCSLLFFPLKSEEAFDVEYLMNNVNSGSEGVFWKFSADCVRINPYVVIAIEKPYEISGRSVVLRMMASDMFSRSLHFVHPLHMLNSK